MNQDEQTIVVVPSITLDVGDAAGATLQAYEERFLFLLLLLRQPRARLDLRDLAADPAERHRLLPRPAARRDPDARARAALHSSRRSTAPRGR